MLREIWNNIFFQNMNTSLDDKSRVEIKNDINFQFLNTFDTSFESLDQISQEECKVQEFFFKSSWKLEKLKV